MRLASVLEHWLDLTATILFTSFYGNMPSTYKTQTAAGGGWSGIELAGHECRVFEAAAPSEHGYTVIYLHGATLGRLEDHPCWTELFERHGLRVVAPITGRSWWSDRLCPEFDDEISAERYVLDVVTPHIAERWSARPPRLALLGMSMGGQGALRMAFKYPDTFPVCAAISPAIDYQQRFDLEGETLPRMYADAEAARQDTATLHIHPLYWPRNVWFCCDPNDFEWHDSAERLRMKLSALGIPHDYDLETEAGGHSFDYYNAMAEPAVGFLVERLEKERLRVV